MKLDFTSEQIETIKEAVEWRKADESAMRSEKLEDGEDVSSQNAEIKRCEEILAIIAAEPAPVAGEGDGKLVYPWDNGDGVLGSGLVAGKHYRYAWRGHPVTVWIILNDGVKSLVYEVEGEVNKAPVSAIQTDSTFTPITEPTNET